MSGAVGALVSAKERALYPVHSINDVATVLRSKGIGAHTFRVHVGAAMHEMLDIPGAIQFSGPRGAEVFDLLLHPFDSLVEGKFLVGKSMINFSRGSEIEMLIDEVDLEEQEAAPLFKKSSTPIWAATW